MLDHLKNELNVSYTENGAQAYETTKSDLLDFFAQGGAMRNRSEQDICRMFSNAFYDDALLAMKALFYFRDVRGGQGERRLFRVILNHLAIYHPEDLAKNLHLIPEFGRWDDLYSVFGTSLETMAGGLIKKQFFFDIKTDNPSLLGKWMKSENASSPESKKLARKTRKILGLTSKQYRKYLTLLRKRINIVESKMSEKNWDGIEYDKLPSQASLKYKQAFYRNDEERYKAFLDSLSKGEKKANAGAVYPYQIMKKLGDLTSVEDHLLNSMWDNLPDYIGDNAENSIAVVDTSGSMYGDPLEVAVSVGLYLAEKNKGAYKNHFITFSSTPELVRIKGTNFCEKARSIKRADWGMNTNIESVFELILNTAVKNGLDQSEIVDKIYIISDMNFDSATTSGGWYRSSEVPKPNKALFKKIERRYQMYGYKMPNLVFWNVDARNEVFPMTMTDTGVQLVSGCSPSIFKHLMKGKFVSAYELMLDVLNDERYSSVTI